MKPISLLLSFLLLLSCAAAASAADAILDADGDELQRGQRYYAVLEMVARDGSCPLYVAKAEDELGQPLAFTPENEDDDTISEGSTLYITAFPEQTPCTESNQWRFDAEAGFVRGGGRSSSSIGPVDSRFAIMKAEGGDNVYNLEVCPCSVGADRPSCRMGCLGSLGLSSVDGKSLLGLNADTSHGVVFKKATGGVSMIRSVAMRDGN